MEEEVTPAVVACGSHHTASISRRGQLFTWGMGNSGELGHGEAAFLETPVPKRSYLFQVSTTGMLAYGRFHCTFTVGSSKII